MDKTTCVEENYTNFIELLDATINKRVNPRGSFLLIPYWCRQPLGVNSLKGLKRREL
jgi:hypothetical protein